jgi:hypothetical protein
MSAPGEGRAAGPLLPAEPASAPPPPAQTPAMAGPYTVADTPPIIQRIEGDLARVIATVRAGDRGLRSLVLTGGFARGEGAMLGGRPQNDYDFVALRGLRRPGVPYAEMAARLERELGLHIDLAPVSVARMPFLAPSIFWYETALRGRVLWGEDLLGRIGVREPADLDPAEGLRLLVNRAAGLLLVTRQGLSAEEADGADGTPGADAVAHAYRIQAAKGLLAALDAHLLAADAFAPSQTERWAALAALRSEGRSPAAVEARRPWFEWAFRFKVEPAAAARRDAMEAWRTAREAILAAVPAALQHAGLPDLEAYALRDRLVDRAVYLRRSASIPQARRLAAHPTGQVRLGTLRLLEASPDGKVGPDAARKCLGAVTRSADDPLLLLDALRHATLQ